MTLRPTVRKSGFRPQLSTSVGGSYLSNSSYGSGASTLNLYTSQVFSGSRAFVNVTDYSVDFDVKIELDTSGEPPSFDASEELRIKAKTLLRDEPARFSAALPRSSRNFGLPLFSDVSLVDKATGFTPTELFNGQGDSLKARLLYNGELAIVNTSITSDSIFDSPPESPLTSGDLLDIFSGTPSSIIISVRGTYNN